MDPHELEQARMQVAQTGFDSEDKQILNVLTYVSFRELAARMSHRNSGKVAGDPIAEWLLTRVSVGQDRAICAVRRQLLPGDLCGHQPGRIVQGALKIGVA